MTTPDAASNPRTFSGRLLLLRPAADDLYAQLQRFSREGGSSRS